MWGRSAGSALDLCCQKRQHQPMSNTAVTKDKDVGASLRAGLASQIIASVERQGLTVREAGVRTGTAAADFSRLRQGQLDRFTIDRLLQIAAHLGEKVDVTVHMAPGDDTTARPQPLAKHLKGLRSLCRRFGVQRLSAFGSVLRSDFKPVNSDIDLAVEIGGSSRLGPADQYFRFKGAIEQQLGRPVDLVELSGMPDTRLKRAILREQVTLYEQAA